VYRVSAKYNLGLFKSKLEEQFTKTVKGASIEMLTSNKLIDVASLDASKCFIQIGSVKPYNVDAYGHIKQFMFEAAHSTERKAIQEDDFSKQQRKCIVFTTSHSLPFAKTRVLVVRREEHILSAAANAFQMMTERVQLFRKQLDVSPPRPNQLQQLISGSFATVNAGVEHIAENFLAKPHQDMNPARRRQLAKIFRTYLKLCGFSIALNKSIIDAKLKKFQAHVEKK
jgi:hypothetical protein